MQRMTEWLADNCKKGTLKSSCPPLTPALVLKLARLYACYHPFGRTLTLRPRAAAILTSKCCPSLAKYFAYVALCIGADRNPLFYISLVGCTRYCC